MYNSSRYGSYHYSFSSDRDQGLKSAEKIYDELPNKPPVLGDTACALLDILVPSPPPETAGTPEESQSNRIAEAQAVIDGAAARKQAILQKYL